MFNNQLGEAIIMQTFKTSSSYVACNHPKAGLIIQSTRKTGGVNMKPDHPQYTAYIEAFAMALDTQEADALCKALLK